jgi:hypothetical protein
MSLRTLFPSAALVVLGGSLLASPPAPPPPETYDVVVHYRIVAFQNERVAQFNEMLARLGALGFRRDPTEQPPADEAADVKATRLRGTVAAAKARSLLLERHVRSLFLLPAGEKLPADANQAVRAVIDLTAGLPLDRQRLLHAQTAEALSAAKFNEAVGYDHRGFTRLVGSIPAGQVELVLSDLHELPSGRNLPSPFANVQAVRVLEVRPDQPVPAARPAPPAVPRGLEKVSNELREVVADTAGASKRLRFEILLADAPLPFQHGWESLLRRTAPGIALEGILGTLVTVTARPDQLAALAALPEVAGLRLPRSAQPVPFRPGADGLSSLVASGLERLHAPGYRGKGNRIAIVAADFAGWEAPVGKGLPKETHLIDLTLERNENLEPDPFPAGAGPGQGTLFAQAISAAAPESEIVLLRVDPAAPYMLQAIARAANGEPSDTLALQQRGHELSDDRSLLDIRRNELLEERRRVLEDLREVDEAIKNREDYRKKQAAFDQDLLAYGKRLRRYLDHQNALLHLKGLRVIASTLVWDTRGNGGGSNAVSRFLGDRPFSSALWLQATGAGAGETWTGLYRDEDGNGTMEFAPPREVLHEGTWSPELNFLALRTPDGKTTPDLPVGTRIRVTLQWREAHDPTLLRIGQDPYREPLSSMKLLLLRQPDPAGAKRPGDDLEVVAQSDGIPRRLDQSLSSATYEISVEYRVTAAGRFALRVEGHLAESDRPASLPTLPVLRRTGETRPRITVETVEGTGRAIWRDFPGDSTGDDGPADAGPASRGTDSGARPSGRTNGP